MSIFNRRNNDKLPLFGKTSNPQGYANFLTGYAFEQFIVSRFDPDFFTLMEWRSDKNLGGRFPLSSQYPDLEFEYEKNRKPYRFAVECKYHATFPDNEFRWTSNALQVDNYREFVRQRKIPVFIVLGYEGTPASPANLFCIPFIDLKKITIDRSFLAAYQRPDPGKPFFLETDSMRLQ